MYQPRTSGYSKRDMAMRWALPDRVFFACGACHVLAYALLERFGMATGIAQWIRPVAGFTGNHIFVEGDGWTFDYHGYAASGRLQSHYFRRARQRYPGWDATLVPLPAAVLISGPLSRRYEGLWLREPGEFQHDALPRARAFLDHFGAPTSVADGSPRAVSEISETAWHEINLGTQGDGDFQRFRNR